MEFKHFKYKLKGFLDYTLEYIHNVLFKLLLLFILNFLFFIPSMLPTAFIEFKKKILDDKLHIGKKPDWIDIYAENAVYKVDHPYVEITDLWNLVNQSF